MLWMEVERFGITASSNVERGNDIIVVMTMTERECHLAVVDSFTKVTSRSSQERRQTCGEVKAAMKSSSSGTSQFKVDSEFIRRKLCDSLTAALEMVVGKQFARNVLGVVRDIEKMGTVDFGRHVKLEAHYNTALAGEGPDEACSKVYKGEVHCSDKLCDSTKSSEKDDTFLETRGGLELMEEAKRVAWNVELNLFSLNGGVNKKYKEKARSLLFNLKDKSNPELRVRVFNGEITPETLVRMSTEQLASKELTQWRSAKAEEFASLVVITEADVDPRRIIERSHKGEFRAVAEGVEFSAVSPNCIHPCVTGIISKVGQNGEKIDQQLEGEEIMITGKVTYDSFVAENQVENPLTNFSQGGIVLKTYRTGDHASQTLGTTCSRDYVTMGSDPSSIHTGDPEPLENLRRSKWKSRAESRKDELSAGSIPDNHHPNSVKSRRTRVIGSGGICESSLLTKQERGYGAAIWEGSIQVSATRYASISGFYKSGERLELSDWPRSIEVKGRVKLEALKKFLQDLQLSRSRKVTVLSLLPSDYEIEGEQTAAYLKEMADQYQIGGRAGFVVPKSGFELYLLAPSSSLLESPNPANARSIEGTSKGEDELLVGVVVWRKTESQRLSLVGADQIDIVKEGLRSNLLESRSEFTAKRLHCTGSRTSEGSLSVFLKTISTPPSVRGTPSGHPLVHTAEHPGDSSGIQVSLSHVDGNQSVCKAADVQVPGFTGPDNRYMETTHRTMSRANTILHHPVKLQEVPPGFWPRPPQTFPETGHAAVSTNPNEDGEGYNGPISSLEFATSQFSVKSNGTLRVRKSSFLEASPSSFIVPSQRAQTTNTEEDDLPEFDFEVNASPMHATSLRKHWDRTHLSGPLGIVEPESFVRLNSIIDYSDVRQDRGQYGYDVHPPLFEVRPALNELHPSCRSRLDEVIAPLASRTPSFVLSNERWVTGRGGGETVSTLTAGSSMTELPLQSSDHGNWPPRSRSQDVVAGEEYCKFGVDFRSFIRPSMSVPLGFSCLPTSLTSRTREPGAESHYPRVENFNSFQSACVYHTTPPCGPPLPTITQCPNSIQEPSLSHLVVRRHGYMTNTAFSWPCRAAAIPWQEEQRHHRSAVDISGPTTWRQSCSVEFHNSAANLGISFEGQEGEHASGSDLRFMRCTPEHTLSRETSQESEVSLDYERGEKRKGSFCSALPRDKRYRSTHFQDSMESGIKNPWQIQSMKRCRETQQDQ